MSESAFSSDHQASNVGLGEPNAQVGMGQAGTVAAAAVSEEVRVQDPEFAPLKDSGQTAGDTSLNRFFDVTVTVSAELGRVTMPIAQLLRLGEGAVVELNRPVTGPVDLVANGVRIARGEVVIVDDCFAIRIKQVEPASKAGG